MRGGAISARTILVTPTASARRIHEQAARFVPRDHEGPARPRPNLSRFERENAEPAELAISANLPSTVAQGIPSGVEGCGLCVNRDRSCDVSFTLSRRGARPDHALRGRGNATKPLVRELLNAFTFPRLRGVQISL